MKRKSDPSESWGIMCDLFFSLNPIFENSIKIFHFSAIIFQYILCKGLGHLQDLTN